MNYIRVGFDVCPRPKFADRVSELQKWKRKNEEIPPKELNEYISDFIVAVMIFNCWYFKSILVKTYFFEENLMQEV